MADWTVLFEPAARKQIRSLPIDVRKRIVDFIEGKLVGEPNPRRHAKALVGQKDLWRFRVGDYRIVAEFRDLELVILVVKVAHRREVYR